MATKKTPAPRRAGTATTKLRNRAAREAALVDGLEKMRAEDPRAFRKLMRLLARLVVYSQ